VTALCGGGTSGPQPGVAEAIIYGAGAIATLLEKRGALWAAALAPLLGVLSYDAISLCSTDPPAIPSFTAADANAVLNLTDFNAFTVAVGKFKDMIANYLWNEICTCTSGPNPAPSPAVPAPPGLPNTTTVISGTGPSLPCDDQIGPERSIGTYGGVTSQQIIPYNDFTGQLVGSPKVNIPAGATAITYAVTNRVFGPTPGRMTFALQEENNQGFNTANTIINAFSGQTTTGQITPQPTTAWWRLNVAWNGAAGTNLASAEVKVWCGTPPNTTNTTCCPADQITLGLLTQILQMVTLVQRQAAPFAFISGTVHSGLSGIGQFSIQGLLGLAISVTTLPPRAGLVVGDPNTLFGLGWINIGTASGFMRRVFIDSQSFVVFPPDMGAMTLVGFSIPSDVVVSITELKREP
jgi:hypothetical protein